MRDEGYIQARGRAVRTAPMDEHDAINALWDSHAVADAVMRELADALREQNRATGLLPSVLPALARYDRLVGDNDE